MLGLIKKDLLMIKSNFKVLVILLFVYGMMAINGEIDLSFLLSIMSVMIVISTFSYDTYNKWDAYTVTLPEGRKNSVRAKYLVTILLTGLTTILVTLLSIIISYSLAGKIDFEMLLATMLGSVFSASLIQSFMYPVIYKYGVEKARIGIFVVVFIITIIGGILFKNLDISLFSQTINFLNNYLEIILPVIMIVMVYLSYRISLRLYMKKEF